MALIPSAVVEKEINAVTLGQGIAALEKLIAGLSGGVQGTGQGVVVIEDIVAMVDPELIPVIGGIRRILPLIDRALAALEPVVSDPVHPAVPGQFSRGR